jgi:hypothetical protein
MQKILYLAQTDPSSLESGFSRTVQKKNEGERKNLIGD